MGSYTTDKQEKQCVRNHLLILKSDIHLFGYVIRLTPRP